ncbi:MAG: Bax inhibitor-1/YccA family protein [Ktedonobacteraceae bacterium]
MYNQRNNSPFGGSNTLGSRYQYQTLPYGYEGTQSSSLIGKVMGLLAFSFLFATLGTFVGFTVFANTASNGVFFAVAIAGLIVLFALNFLIQKPGINLFLLYLFTFLEGMSLAPLISYYLLNGGYILAEAFLITTLTAFGLAAYSWTTKRDFTHLGDYLFFGVLLLLVAGILGIFLPIFNTGIGGLLISVIGVAIFSGYVLYYVQRAKYMADTLPNAIGLTVSLFITLINLFLYILRILSILQGGNRRR